ncbi:protein of unknown function DUF305 [Gloeothece citriformis PCC 7424]|uniref:DUF305 domain-containing protein n=1 Tax=Gloeothece citriformis (strain PCC 7424) TaxID=65393 RepID=B7K726_GLOC7|nr:DUF305 domain-containing protein [Gloeothece citriformis]ACK69594.1 protein of unknown function DUF305 [Gloeothece citriformis PCC 7424]
MKKQSLIYSLVGFLATGSLTGLLLINPTQAQSPHNHNHSGSSTSEQHCEMGMLNQQQKDQHFMEMIIFHHQGAIEMAELALIQAKRPEIKQLAQEIKKTKTEEMEEIKNQYQQWYGAEVSNPNHCDMTSMMSTNLETLKNASDFDKVLIENMIPHHEHALMMSEMVLNTDRPELRNLANRIIQTQNIEIEQMRQLLKNWN